MRWAYISTLQTKTSLGACKKCLCWLPGLSGSPATSSHQRASHGESPPGKCTPPLVRYVQQSPTSRSEMTPRRDIGDWQKSSKYCGAWPCRQLYIMTLSLYMTRCGTSSQCSSAWRSVWQASLELLVTVSSLKIFFRVKAKELGQEMSLSQTNCASVAVARWKIHCLVY